MLHSPHPARFVTRGGRFMGDKPACAPGTGDNKKPRRGGVEEVFSMEEKKTTIEVLVCCTIASMGVFGKTKEPIHFKVPVWMNKTFTPDQRPKDIISLTNTDGGEPTYVEFDVYDCNVEVKED